ncbi:hypothetical protein [Pedosphaera parvula]|uniref:Uncharacterized protein n=1 Tax=Pedosphaera parvula (strain Ellin514) TaxID=320771 RepID=B9XG35_PEDPL|nr:hypothetical protein [Pedosphaera parvula]EEF61197.1 hypothetical protein Cflav_PD3914 [Pedosphaera parvula Ellin514]
MEAVIQEIFDHPFGCVRGPLAFRLIIQPLVAVSLAILAGLKDAREGYSSHGWVIATDSSQKLKLLHESWKDAAKLSVAAVIVDLIYEIIVFQRLYPGQTLIVATISDDRDAVKLAV